MSSIERPTSQPELAGEWNSAILTTDGSVRNHGQTDAPNETALGYRLETPNGDTITENSLYLGTNNNIHNCEAEALAVLAGIYAAQENNITAIYLHTDSKVVVDHLNNVKHASTTTLQSVLHPIDNLLDTFLHTTISHLPRTDTRITTVHDLAHTAFPPQ